jgi:hypothetical protein
MLRVAFPSSQKALPFRQRHLSILQQRRKKLRIGDDDQWNEVDVARTPAIRDVSLFQVYE